MFLKFMTLADDVISNLIHIFALNVTNVRNTRRVKPSGREKLMQMASLSKRKSVNTTRIRAAAHGAIDSFRSHRDNGYQK